VEIVPSLPSGTTSRAKAGAEQAAVTGPGAVVKSKKL